MGNLFYDEQPKLKQSDLRIGDWVQMRPEYGPVEDEDGDMMSNDLLDSWGCNDDVLFGPNYDNPSIGIVIGRHKSKGIRARWCYNGNVEEQDVPLEAVVKVQEPPTRIKNALEQTD